jgi:hypothetical protein
LGLFFAKQTQPYWENISASSLSKQAGCHPRTIIRYARLLGIGKGVLSEDDKGRVLNRNKWQSNKGVHYGIIINGKMLCYDCQSPKIRKAGFAISRKGKKQRYQCKDCGRIFMENNG